MYGSDFENHSGKKSKKKIITISILLVIVFYFATSPDVFFEIMDRYEISDSISDVSVFISKFGDDHSGMIDDAVSIINTGISDIENQVSIIDVSDVKMPVRLESGFDAGMVENHIYEFTNKERESRGLPALLRVSTIDLIARNHSQDMSDRDYFKHDTPEGLSPTDRGIRAGYDCRKDYGTHYTYGLGENIHQTHTYSYYSMAGIKTSYVWMTNEIEVAEEIVDGWMDSPGHRENILNVAYDRIGVGVVINSDEQVYSTQNFC